MAGNPILKQNGESDHDHYMRIADLKTKCIVELSRQRCVDCVKFAAGMCTQHNTKVPDDYIFAVNDCEFYEEDQIPF